MNLLQANFENLLETYHYGTASIDAAEQLDYLIQNQQQNKLSKLLRDYRVEAVTLADEINFRAATDRLMKCCSVMEIASLTDFIPNLHETDFGIEMRRILEDKYVRCYYEEFYPQKLPQLFRLRLAGGNCTVEKLGSGDINRIIMVFLDLDRRFMETLDDGHLLRLLDSFSIGGYRFSDVIELIKTPDDFINQLLLAPSEQDVMSHALNEFSLFIDFCFDLRRLLLQAEVYPLVQSAIWNHYGYWFNIIGIDFKKQLGEALNQFLNWQPENNKEDVTKAVQAHIDKAYDALEFLTQKKFAEPIDVLLENVMAVR